MILTGPAIEAQRALGAIVIEPFSADRLNPNSFDLTLGDRLLLYARTRLDPSAHNPTVALELDSEGYWLTPGRVYLASTVEYTETHYPWVPLLEGKSSLGRLGLSVHATAGFGDHGFCGAWTLELSVIQPVLVRPGMRICQIAYHRCEGPPMPYRGRYQGQRGPTPARREA